MKSISSSTLLALQSGMQPECLPCGCISRGGSNGSSKPVRNVLIGLSDLLVDHCSGRDACPWNWCCSGGIMAEEDF